MARVISCLQENSLSCVRGGQNKREEERIGKEERERIEREKREIEREERFERERGLIPSLP